MVSDRFVEIEQIRVGQRVFAENPDPSQPNRIPHTAVDPHTWRRLVLEADYQWPDGTLDPIHVETLQPREWMESRQAAKGREVDIPFDLRDMGLPEQLRARVVDIQPCPPIPPGPGQIVLTTINHLHNDVVELIVRDQRGRQEAIRPTGFHKFYSETRGSWVSAEDLQNDEVLASRHGPITVVSRSRVPGIHRVYNMTVEGEHVYNVGRLSTTAHNGCSASVPPDFPNRTPPSPAVDGSPYSPGEVQRRQSNLREEFGLPKGDLETPLPDMHPGPNGGMDGARPKRPSAPPPPPKSPKPRHQPGQRGDHSTPRPPMQR